MNTNEFIPIVSGLVIGWMLSGFRSRPHRILTSLLTVLVGFLTTFASGELRISWTYVLADIALVNISALCSFAVSSWHRISTRPAAGRTQQFEGDLL